MTTRSGARRGRFGVLPAALLAALLLAGGTPARALNFFLTDGAELAALASSNPALYSQVRGGFDDAAAQWSALLTNNVTVNVTVNYRDFGNPGIIGQASTVNFFISYADARNALIAAADPLSATDQAVVANLPGAAPAYVVRNAGVTINNGSVGGTKANLKALGFNNLDMLFGARDATIEFNSGFTFDFNRNDGIAGNQVDFVGTAAHEIGHSLGFTSVVDDIDFDGAGTYTPFFLDLFRFSRVPFSSATERDLSADTAREKYFSLDNGATDADGGPDDLYFSTGVFEGDGNQASHWKDNRGLGIMDPTAADGELLTIVNNDLLAFDAIGWNRASFAAVVPEPGTLGFVLLGGAGVLLPARRGRRGRRAAVRVH